MTQGGLAIDGPVGAGIQVEQEVHDLWNTFDAVECHLIKLGVQPVEKPNYPRPRLAPGLLESGSARDISDLQIKYGAWHSYIANLLGRVRALNTQVANEMTILTIRLKKDMVQNALANKQRKPSDKQLEVDSKLDPRYQELMLQKQKLEQQIQLLEPHNNDLGRELRIVSRQVELRRQELEHLNPTTGNRQPVGTHVPGRMNYR